MQIRGEGESMKTIAQYQHLVDEAKAKPARESHQLLLEIETSLTQDIFAYEAQYRGRAAAGINPQQKRSGKERMESEQHLLDEKQRKLQPYQDLRKQIKEILEKPVK
jgi:hypothetical protein